MARTFDQRQEERAEENKDVDPDGGEWYERSSLKFRGKTIKEIADSLGDILVPTPDELLPEGLQQRRGRRRDDTIELLQQILSGSDIDIDGMGEDIQDALDRLENASQTELLRIIANMSIHQTQLAQTNLSTQVSTLQAMIDTATAVEAPRAITVSGVNSVNNANEPEPLVPQSDEEEIPTRTVYVRASPDNDSGIYIGDDSIDPDNGFLLKKGESWELPVDLRDEQYYMVSETEGDVVQLLGVF